MGNSLPSETLKCGSLRMGEWTGSGEGATTDPRRRVSVLNRGILVELLIKVDNRLGV